MTQFQYLDNNLYIISNFNKFGRSQKGQQEWIRDETETREHCTSTQTKVGTEEPWERTEMKAFKNLSSIT